MYDHVLSMNLYLPVYVFPVSEIYLISEILFILKVALKSNTWGDSFPWQKDSLQSGIGRHTADETLATK